MRYSKNWLYIDILVFVTFLPFFFVLPLLMKLFVIFGLYFVYRKNTAALWVLGAFCIVFSFYNFWELKDFRVYVKFLASMLIWGYYLQRTKEVNFYVKLTPFLFFGLSIVFFQNVYMLFYMLFEIFVFLMLAFYRYMGIKESFFKSLQLFLISLPVVTVLFLFFPRVHQRHFIFGFLGKNYSSGFSEIVKTTNEKITLNKIPVVELKLSKAYPKIYLRGDVLNVYKNGEWVRGVSIPDKLVNISNLEVYYLKEYPNLQNHIFAVDLPIESEYGRLDKNFVLKSKKPINKLLFIQVTSAMKYKISPVRFPFVDLIYDKTKNPKSQKEAKRFLKIKNEKKRLNEIIKFFKSQKIIYSLNPKNLDPLNIVDSLFKEKRGYCTHFASAFTLFCRMAALPARVVVGYMSNSSIKGYYKIYSKDAHAWSEVLVDNVWVRVDPTEFAYKNESIQEFKKAKPSYLDVYVSYVRFLIEEWILKYDAFKQAKFLKFFKAHFVTIIISFLIFVVLTVLIAKNLKKKELLDPLYKKLKKRPHKQSVYEFLSSFNDERLDEINELYQKIVFYKSTKEDIKKLKKLIKNYKGEK
jgi:transglutaminase-like putative cysteine protease